MVDIGLDRGCRASPAVERLRAADLAAPWPVPGPAGRQVLGAVCSGVVAGGQTYTGAAVLCAGAAVRRRRRDGALRRAAARPPTWSARAGPRSCPATGRVQAWVVGPGSTRTPSRPGRAAALEALAERPPVRRGRRRAGPAAGSRRAAAALLTPHAGELARLLSRLAGPTSSAPTVEAAPLRHARRAAELTGATVLLKGATSLVVGPDGRVAHRADGPRWLATAGSGDVLAGLAGALLAAGLDPLDAGAVRGRRARAGRPAGELAGPISASPVRAVPAPGRAAARRGRSHGGD